MLREGWRHSCVWPVQLQFAPHGNIMDKLDLKAAVKELAPGETLFLSVLMIFHFGKWQKQRGYWLRVILRRKCEYNCTAQMFFHLCRTLNLTQLGDMYFCINLTILTILIFSHLECSTKGWKKIPVWLKVGSLSINLYLLLPSHDYNIYVNCCETWINVNVFKL